MFMFMFMTMMVVVFFFLLMMMVSMTVVLYKFCMNCFMEMEMSLFFRVLEDQMWIDETKAVSKVKLLPLV